MRSWAICLFLNLFVCFFVKGQQIVAFVPFEKQIIKHDTLAHWDTNVFSPFLAKNINLNNTLLRPVPSTFYFNSIGFFCKKELQIEKAINFPLRFRLGSVAYTDQMEGKANAKPFR